MIVKLSEHVRANNTEKDFAFFIYRRKKQLPIALFFHTP
jgi:hypothetical protein